MHCKQLSRNVRSIACSVRRDYFVRAHTRTRVLSDNSIVEILGANVGVRPGVDHYPTAALFSQTVGRILFTGYSIVHAYILQSIPTINNKSRRARGEGGWMLVYLAFFLSEAFKRCPLIR